VQRESPPAEHGGVLRIWRRLPILVQIFGSAIVLVVALAILRFVTGWKSDLFQLGGEANIPTWLATAQLFTVAAVLGPLALRDGHRNRLTFLIPAFFALLSLDEAARLHERGGDWLLRELEIGVESKSGPWMILFVPIIGLLGILAAAQLWRYLRTHRVALRLMVAGALILAFSAVGLALAANPVLEDSALHRVIVLAEESGEMLGGFLLLWGAVRLIEAEGIVLDLDAR